MSEVADQLSVGDERGVKGVMCRKWNVSVGVCRVLCWLVGVSEGERKEERRRSGERERKKKKPSPLFVGETEIKNLHKSKKSATCVFFRRLKLTS